MLKQILSVLLLLLAVTFRGVAQEYDGRKYGSGENDGYSLAEIDFVVAGISGEKEVCLGGDVVYSTFVKGTSVYTYSWKKLNGTILSNLVGTDSSVLKITSATDGNAGKYYCEVKDLRSGAKRYTDTVELKVYHYPSLTLAASLKKIAEGAEVALTASGASSYTWSTRETTPVIKVKPAVTTVYTLTAFDKELCPLDTSVKIEVVSRTLEVGTDMYISVGESVTLKAATPLEKVNWYRIIQTGSRSTITEQRVLVAETPEVTLSPDTETIYEAEATFTGQTIKKRLTVFVKDGRAYSSGEEDGFALGSIDFSVAKISGARELCVGADGTFMTFATGVSGYTYRWKRMIGNTATDIGSDSTVLNLKNVTSAADGKYFCEVTDVRSGSKRNTDTVELKIYAYPDLDLIASLTKVAEGTSVNLKASGAPHYKWSTGDTLGNIVVKPLVTTIYRVTGYIAEVCPKDTFLTIEVLKLELNIGPNRYISPGESATLVAQTPLDTVRWYRIQQINGSGGTITEQRILLANAKEVTQTPDSATVYEAEATYTGRSITRRLTVYVKGGRSYSSGRNDGFSLGKIDFNVQNITYPGMICEGDSISLITFATGPSIYSFQWKKLQGAGAVTLGQDSAVLWISNIKLIDNGKYFCEVTDKISGQKKCTDTVEIKAKIHPVITIGSPVGEVLLCYGDKVTLDARDTEFDRDPEDTYTYSWRGSSILGKSDTTIVIVQPPVTGDYILTVDNAGCIARDTVTVKVYRPSVDIPAQLILSEGEMMNLMARTDGSASLSWYLNGKDNLVQQGLATEPFIYGPVKQPVTIYVSMEYAGCGAVDSCKVTVKNAYAYSSGRNDGFSESCRKPVIIKSTPSDITGCTADSLVISLWVEGSQLEYTWQKEVNYDFVDLGPLAGQNVSGLGSNELKFRPPLAEDEGLYRCVIRNGCGEEQISDTFAVSVRGAPVFRTKLNRDWKDQCLGTKSAELAVSVIVINSKKDLNYAWKKDKNTLPYTTAGITVPLDDLSRAGWYKVTVTNDCGTISDSTYLPVYVPAFIKSRDSVVYACDGGNAQFVMEPGGGGDYTAALYEVIREASNPQKFTLINPAVGTGLKVVIPNVDARFNDKYYVWIIKNLCGADTSKLIRLRIENQPEILSVSRDVSICAGEALRLNCQASGSITPLTYEWYKNGVSTGQKDPDFYKQRVVLADSGIYVCRVTNKSCGIPVENDPIRVAIHDKPAVSAAGIYVKAETPNSKGEFCQGTPLKLKVDILPPYEVDSVRWYRNGIPLYGSDRYVSGTATTELELDSVTVADAGNYRIYLYNKCGVLQVTPYKLTVIQPATFVLDGNNLANMSICQGKDQVLTVTTAGTAPIRYTWTHNGTVVADGYSSSIHLKDVTVDTSGVYCCEIHNACDPADGKYVRCAEIKVIHPVEFELQGGGSYCVNGENGVPLILAGSDTSSVYRLYKNGTVIKTVNGKDYAGAPVTFENNLAGTYYVTALSGGCEFRMPGTIEIKENKAPVVYPLIFGKQYCTGTNGATLQLSGSENNPDITYTLQRQNLDGTWVAVTTPFVGTGAVLTWEQIKAGSYRVEAVNRITGCTNLMSGLLTVAERALPEIVRLAARDNDSIYCAGTVSDVELYLTTSQADCHYTLVKDGTDHLAQGTTWKKVVAGVYTVEAVSNWGCERSFGKQNVQEQQQPQVTLVGGTVYCESDTGKHKIEISGLDRDVDYIIYQKTPLIQYGHLSGIDGTKTIEVPLETKDYYIVATDKTPERCSSTSVTVSVRKSGFAITAPAEITIANGAMTTLTVTVTGQSGPVNVEWTPAEWINGDNTQTTVTTKGLQKGKTFTVKVTDAGGCVQKTTVKVTVTGTELEADIRKEDRLTSVDTVHLCANELLTLYGWRDGGTGIYTSAWYDGTGRIAGADNNEWLNGYDKNISGYIYYQVGSGAITVRDSVYVDVLDTVVIPPFNMNGVQCIAGEDYTLTLPLMEAGAVYSLEYDAAGTGGYITSTGGISGDLGSYDFVIRDIRNVPGYYRINATVKYGEKTCRTYSEVVELRAKPLEFTITEDAEYCAGAKAQDTVRVSGGERGVDYTLVRVPGNTPLGTKNNVTGPFMFTGNYGTGTYAVKAQLGKCEIWLKDSVTIQVNTSPEDKVISGAGSYCEIDEALPVSIGVRSATAGTTYTLYRRINGIDELLTQQGPLAYGGNLVFGQYNIPGEYYVIAGQAGIQCERTLTGRVNIGESPVSFDVHGNNTYLWGDNVPETVVKAFHTIKTGVQYKLYKVRSATPVGILGNYNNDTVYYRGALAQGYYVVRAEAGTCAYQSADTVKIEAVLTPYCIQGDSLYCETGVGSGVNIGIDGTQIGVKYILQTKNAGTGAFTDIIPAVTLMGSGYPDKFSGLFRTGDYRIIADNGTRQLMCGELHIRPQISPDTNIIVDIAGNVCADSTVTIAVGTETGVNYMLYYQGGFIQDTLKGNGTAQKWILDPVKKGTYKIKADNGKCSLVLPREIEAGTPPSLGQLDGDTLLCANMGGILTLSNYDPQAVNTLYKITGEKVAVGTIENGQCTFKNILPDNYYAEASIGMCKVRSNIHAMRAIPAVNLPADLIFDYEECTENGQGAITFNGLAVDQKYVITGASLPADVHFGAGITTYALTDLSWGEYCLKATESGSDCPSSDTCFTILEKAPLDTIAENPVYCEGGYGTYIQLSGYTTGAVYNLYDENGVLKETLNNGTAFKKLYTEGTYILEKQVKGIFDGCIDRDTVRVKKVQLPSVNLKPRTDGTGTLCAGIDYRTGLQTTEPDVTYILRQVQGGKFTDLDTLNGDGAAQWFSRTISRSGYYRIYAQPVGTDCGVYLDSILHINAVPAKIELLTCNLCGTTTSACMPQANRLESDTRYILYKNSGIPVDTLTGPGNKSFKKQFVGNYYVIGQGIYSGCQDTMGTLKIEIIPEPRQFAVNIECASSAAVATTNSEIGVKYTLYRNNKIMVDTLSGTGISLNFGIQTVPGIYKVWAENIAGCGRWLADSVTIYNSLQDCALKQSGEYCGSGSAGISLSYECSVPGWKYYLEKWPLCSDTLAGNLGTISWTKVNGKALLPGTYRLYAYNNCKDTLLQTYMLLQMVTPKELTIAGRDVFCSNEGFEIKLPESENGVDYRLVFVAASGKETLLANGVGNGDTLQLGTSYVSTGRYRVYGKYTGSSCEAIVAEKVFIAGAKPKQQYLTGKDICLNVADSISLGISQKENQVTYYLYRTDTKTVMDSLTPLRSGMTFSAQKDLACYAAYALSQQSGCRTEMVGVYCLNKEPQIFEVENPGDTVAICVGQKYSVKLLDSDPATKYQLIRNNVPYGKQIVGDGDSMIIGEVSDAGIYKVRASNGCEELMKDSVIVKVNPLPAINKEQNFYRYCDEGAGVNIKLTTTAANVEYTLISPDKTIVGTYSGTGAGLTFEPVQQQKGFYRIEAKNMITGCIGRDSAEIYIDSLPQPYLLTSDKYICAGGSVTIKLSGSEKGTTYTLWRGDTRLSAKNGDGNALTFPNIKITGDYTIVAKNTWCEHSMMNKLTLRQADTVKRFELQGTKTFYCYSDTDMGTATLRSSQKGVEYELYRDGIPTGSKLMGTGMALEWNHLKGKTCSQYSDGTDNEEEEGGFIYHIVGHDTLTNCVQAMNGKVVIIEETDAKVVWSHPNKDLTTCQDSSVDFTVIANGCNLNYTWWQRGSDGNERILKDGKEDFWQIEKAEQADFGTYWCEITNSCSVVAYTSPVAVKVRKTMELNPDRNVSVCDGKTTTVKLEAVFYADTYAWYKAGDPDRKLLGSKQVLTLENITAATAGKYICVASNGCYTITDTCVVRIGGKPSVEIIKAVTDTLCRGSQYELLVNSPDSVMWRLNGKDLPGKTGNRLYISSVDSTHQGHYSVRVIGGCNELLADIADLYVDDTIRINRITNSNTILCAGNTADLYIETTPSDRVAYRWEYLGMEIGRGNHITYGPLENSNTGYTFRVFFTNTCIMENAAHQPTNYRDVHLLVNEAAKVEDPVSTVIICAGEKADTVLRIKHENLLGMTYSWHYYGAKSDTAMLSSKADTVIVPLRTDKSGYYFCRVNNGCEVIATNACWVRVDSVPVLLGSLQDDTVCEGSGFTRHLRATGGSLNYDWMIRYRDGREAKLAHNNIADYNSTGELEIPVITMEHDSALIWCHVYNHCSAAGSYSDTMLLRVNPWRIVTVSPDTVYVCGTEPGQVIVSLLNGEKPWTYTYTTPKGMSAVRKDSLYMSDTLHISGSGKYRITSLADATGCVKTNNLPVFEVVSSEIPEPVLSGGGTRCQGDTVSVRLHINKGVGPWEIILVRESDGQPATEIAENNGLLHMYGRDTSITFTVSESEDYYIYQTIKDLSSGCSGKLLETRVHVTVNKPDHIDFRTGWPTHVGQCKDLNLRDLLKPAIDGVAVTEGGFYINDKPLNGSNWLQRDLRADCYQVSYFYKNEYNCLVTSDEIHICVDSLPYGEIVVPDYACEGVVDSLKIELYPAAQNYTVKFYQYRYQHKPGAVRSDFRTVQVPAANKGLYSEPLSWIMNPPVDSCMRFEIVGITDSHGCSMAADMAEALRNKAYRDTVYLRQRTHLKILTRTSDTAQWITTPYPINIARGDSVGVRAILEKGTPPWTLTTGLSNWNWIRNILVRDTAFWLHNPAIYDFKAEDDYCGLSGNTEEVEVNWLDTGYIRGKLWLEGPYDPLNKMMHSGISAKLLQSYGKTAWPVIANGKDVIDYVSLELRAGTSAASVAELSGGARVIARDTCLLLSDGRLADRITGDTIVGLKNVASGNGSDYYVVVRHRNHIGVMSAIPVRFSRNKIDASVLDFTKTINVYSKDRKYENHMSLHDQTWLLSAGELNENNLITIFDPNRITIDDTGNSAIGAYDLLHDVNFDGKVDWPSWNGSRNDADWSKVRRNRSKFSEIR